MQCPAIKEDDARCNWSSLSSICPKASLHCLANYWYTMIHWPVHLLQERPRMKATKELYTAPLGKKQAMTSPELWPKAQLISAVTAGATLGAVQLGAAGCSCSWVQLGAAGCSFQLRLSWLQHCSIAAGRGEAPTEPLWRIQLIRPSDRSLHELHWPSHHPIGLRTTAWPTADA